MRISESSYLEFVDLIDLDNPVSSSPRLKQVGTVIIGNGSSRESGNLRSVNSNNIQTKGNLFSSDLQEVVYSMIG